MKDGNRETFVFRSGSLIGNPVGNDVMLPPVSDPFYGPFLKVERAEHHIDQLQSIFRNYICNNVKRLRPKHNQRSLKGNGIHTFPRHTSTILGDAIHNLRVALDHVYHIAAEANSATFSEYRKFPFAKDRKSLEGSINGHKQKGLTPSDKVIDVILDHIQPYEGGQFGLYALNKLDITDKHIVLIPTSTQVAIDSLDFVDATGAKTGSGIYGITIVKQNPQQGGELFAFPGGGGAKLQNKPQDAFSIVFQKGQPFEGQSILDTVRSLRHATIEALTRIQAAA
jgi:hypothetical protein